MAPKKTRSIRDLIPSVSAPLPDTPLPNPPIPEESGTAPDEQDENEVNEAGQAPPSPPPPVNMADVGPSTQLPLSPTTIRTNLAGPNVQPWDAAFGLVAQMAGMLKQQQEQFAVQWDMLATLNQTPQHQRNTSSLRFDQPREVDLLERFSKLRLPVFKGTSDPSIAEDWLKQIEKVLEAMNCPDDQKVRLASFILQGEADVWWRAAKRMVPANHVWTWNEFQEKFREKHFPKAYRTQKMVEFSKLEQGSMSVAQYEAKFAELAGYVPKVMEDEDYKITKFEEGLRHNIRTKFCCVDVKKYSEVVDKALRAEQDTERFLKSRVQLKETGQRYRPTLTQHQPPEKKPRMEIQSSTPRTQERYFSGNCAYCGKYGHMAQVCRTKMRDMGITPLQQIPPRLQLPASSQPTSQTSQASHTQPPRPQQNQQNRPSPSIPQGQGNHPNRQQPLRARVYSISSKENLKENNNVVKGMIETHGTSIFVLFDSGATLSFISSSLVSRLRLKSEILYKQILVESPIGKSIILDKICKSIPLMIGDIPILANLIKMSMAGYDVILGMDWLTRNHATLDCYAKTVTFAAPGREPIMIQGKKKNEKIERVMTLIGLPPRREVDFGIDLLPRSAPISMSPYRMAPIELKEVKEQLEDLRSRGFI
ncbi:uncharacterized protein LOC131228127 [Magnolia sinica]|uniref:uncharacterized protein LOC131228127 n=1 Tax=Magnolia sinica TaxID=86752 RepID=UPI002657AF71|nr:uncharacterized protein LOC131228127 [Magnolia sinica]